MLFVSIVMCPWFYFDTDQVSFDYASPVVYRKWYGDKILGMELNDDSFIDVIRGQNTGHGIEWWFLLWGWGSDVLMLYFLRAVDSSQLLSEKSEDCITVWISCNRWKTSGNLQGFAYFEVFILFFPFENKLHHSYGFTNNHHLTISSYG